MHETMVAESLLAAISAESEKQNARPTAAKISCGQLAAINDELLNFAFDAIAKGTPCEGVKLCVEHKPLQGQCRKCDTVFDFEITSPICPNCRCDDIAIIPEQPLILETIQFNTE